MSAFRERAGAEGGLPPEATAIFAGLEGRIARPPVHRLYHVGLVLAALALVALPLIYIALIGAVGLAIWLAAGAVESWAHPTAGVVIVMVLGGTVVLFLVKPLLATPARAAARKPLALRRDRHPLLFALVERLSAVVGSPSPSRIDVDTEPNASASPRRGFVSLVRNDLVLTIGLPLAGAFDLRAFAGIIAHELGHFAQGAGMRLTYVVRSINGWFARVSYERDRWDEWLAAVTRWMPYVGFYPTICIAGSRALLRGLMHVGHAVSCFAHRQMEYDADRYHALLAGVDAFEDTSRRMSELVTAAQVAWEELGALYREGRLADDVSALILARDRALPAETRAAIRKADDAGKTALFDTHPSARDRIAAVRALGDEGLVRDRRPARTLFPDFEALSREVTRRVYAARLGDEVENIRLVPVHALVEDAATDELAHAALERIIGGSFHPSLLLFGEDTEGARGTAEDRAKTAKEVGAAFDRIIVLARALSCARAGRWHLAKGVGSPPALPADIQASIRAENARLRDARARARRVFADASRKLAAAPAAGRVLAAARAIERAWPLVEKLLVLAHGLDELAPYAHEASEDGQLAGHVATMAGRIQRAHEEVAAALSREPHPFLEETLGVHAIEPTPAAEPGAALAAARATLESLAALRLRALARLALAAERASA